MDEPTVSELAELLRAERPAPTPCVTTVWSREGYPDVLVETVDGTVTKVATRDESWHSWGPPLTRRSADV